MGLLSFAAIATITTHDSRSLYLASSASLGMTQTIEGLTPPMPDDCLLLLFQAPRLFSVGAPSVRAAIADFNNDGNKDIAVVSFDSHFVAVFLGDGTGNFSAPSILPAGDFSVPIATGDFNRDGNADLAVGSRDGFVWIYLGNGTGEFGPVSKYADGSGEAYDISVADFNYDGNPDLAIAHQFGGLGILLGDGVGGFPVPVTYNNGLGPVEVDHADFNNDGNIDLITDNAQGGNATVFLGDGAGGFSIRNLSMPRPSGFGIADLDGDGNVDIVVTDSVGYVLRLGDGNGNFSAPIFLNSGGGKAKVADFNGDGHLDIAGTSVGTDGTWQVSILLSDGSGEFQPLSTYPTGSAPPGDFEVADFNNDGKPDIVTINQYGGNISVLINTNGSPDTTPPIVSVSDSVVDAMGPAGAQVPYSLTAWDDSGRVASLSCNIPSGSMFPVGTTQIVCTSADYCGNTGSQSFNVTVNDLPPVLSLPNGVTLGDSCPAGKVVHYTAMASDTVSGNLPVTCDPPSGNTFPLGETAVTCRATDGTGQTATGTFNVDVLAGPVTSFEPSRYFNLGGAFRTASGDFNADGKMDIAVTNSGMVGIFYGDGTGNFADPIILPGAGFDVPPASGDFNHDSKTDLVVGGEDGNVWVYLNNGPSGLGQPTLWPDNGGEAYEIQVADFNSDGNLDLAIGHQFSGLAILFGDGIGGFSAPVEYLDGYGPVQVSKADFNSDGKVDLITANAGTGDVSLLMNSGDGTFTASSPSIPPTDFGIGDFNGDSKTDVVVGNDDGSVRIYFGDGSGGFSAGGIFPTGGSGPNGIKATDINGDGKVDLVVSNGWSDFVSVLLGDGNGNLGYPFTFPVASGPIGITITDLNLDGKPDIVVAAYFAGGFSVLSNTTDTTSGTTCDQVPPTTIPALSATPNAAGWNNSNVYITLHAADNLGGSGVRYVTYSTSGAQSTSLTVSGSTANFAITAEGTTTITYFATDDAGNVESGHTLVIRIDKTRPVISLASPVSGNYLLNQPVTVSFTCTDGGSGVATCDGTTATEALLNTGSVGAKTFMVVSTDNVGNAASPANVNYTVKFAVTVLFDQAKAARSGSTIPIKIRLIDATGANVSSASKVVHAISVTQTSSQASTVLDDAGNSNPDFDFRYDASLGGYIFNLKTTGYGTGSYLLNFVSGDNTTSYSVGFQVRQ